MKQKKLRLNKSKKHSYGASNSNAIIHGDSLKVLEVLKEDYTGKVKCIYIDPPYNNGENYHHYSDDKSHETWLAQMESILNRLEPLLAKDGSIWISIDDNEMHYLKVKCDSIFGRKNFTGTIVWEHRTTRENRSIFSRNHEYILVYAKDPQSFKRVRNLLPLSKEVLSRYKNPDNDSRGSWQSVSANVQDGHATKSQFYTLIAPNGKKHTPPNGRCWVYNKNRIAEEINSNNVWFGKDGNGAPRIKKFLNGAAAGLTPETLWQSDDVGTTQSAKKHFLELFQDDVVFDTPKPETLISKILKISTNEGDLVLDCFLGSGSTISTAHKMKRNYIGVEIGNHIFQIVVERMKKVVEGEQGGISKETKWKGGGGFNFYKLR